ncbi:MAG: spermidine/putrescine ABC transporter substrate-binding protein, partial [Clostridia bacterium]|nr:spermidine/putrescine ABC transporter substrate-binding protein [Clostridia bacterium]
YDVIIPSDYMIARLIDEDMLEKLDLDNIPNYANVDEAYKNTDYDPQNEYSVPYTWGTVGVIYNTKYVTETPDSWDILWDSKYSGKILMFDNPRDAFAIAEYKLGYSINSSDEKEFEACAEILKKQKPLVQNYVMDQIYEAMINEEAYVAPYYAGDFLQMQVDNENLAFAFPKEGFNIFIDAACVPKGAQNKEAAEMYINFLCEPEISGQNLDYLGYSTPISAAKEYMDEETVASDIAYPDEETLSRATSFTFLDTATTQNMDKLWNGVRTGDTAGDTGSSMTGVIIGIIVVAVAAVVFLVLRSVQRKKRIAARGE